MYCIRCGKENLDSAKFCNECGYDFRTIKIEQSERKDYVQPEPVQEKPPVKATAPVFEETAKQVEEASAPEKKKGGFLRRVFFTSLVVLAVFFVRSGGLTELINEFQPEPEYEPVFIQVPEPDSRYDIVIEGTADDEFCSVMEMLIDERDTMENPVFARYEWKVLEKFKGAEFEHYDLGRLAASYLQVTEAQGRLVQFGTSITFTDEDLYYKAQNNKDQLLIYMMLYGGLMPDRPEVCEHYKKMDYGYICEQILFEDLKAQLVDTPPQLDAGRNVKYGTYTNNTEMTCTLKFKATYEYPDEYDGSGGYGFEEFYFENIRPGQTVCLEYTKMDVSRNVNLGLRWELEKLYDEGEEIYAYYQQYR